MSLVAWLPPPPGPSRPPPRVRARVPSAALDPDYGGAGVFEGYASLFGVPDLAGDVVAPGAFRASLKRRGPEDVRLLWQHDPADPAGHWLELRENARGLVARGRLALATPRGREAHALLRAGAVTGLSIGFRTIAASRRPGGRLLAEVELWEISLVTRPLLPGARVSGVKGGPSPSP